MLFTHILKTEIKKKKKISQQSQSRASFIIGPLNFIIISNCSPKQEYVPKSNIKKKLLLEAS